MNVVGITTPLDTIAEDPVCRRPPYEALDSKDEWIVRHCHDRHPGWAQQAGDRAEHRFRIGHVLEHLRADDAVERRVWQAQGLDLALEKANVVACELFFGKLQIDARDIDRSKARLREHEEDVASSRANLGNVEIGDVTHESTNNRQAATLDHADQPRGTLVIVVAWMLESKAVVECLQFSCVRLLGHPMNVADGLVVAAPVCANGAP